MTLDRIAAVATLALLLPASAASAAHPAHHPKAGNESNHAAGQAAHDDRDLGELFVGTANLSADWRTDETHRYVKADGLPSHQPGQFPNRGNPNTIRSQSYSFRMPLEPSKAREPIDAGGMPFGIATSGVVFDPGTAETWRGDPAWRYEAITGGINLGLDAHHAHVQPTGAYHYHGMPTGLVKELKDKLDSPAMVLIGYAADGFPIYAGQAHEHANDPQSPLINMKPSWRVKAGDRPGGPGGTHDGKFVADWEFVDGLGDLDQCNGREGVTPEYPAGTYYYVVTEDYPFIPRYFRGEPDDSFKRRGPRGRAASDSDRDKVKV